MSAVIKTVGGLPGPYDLSSQLSYTKSGGWVTTVTKIGQKSELDGLLNTLAAAGYNQIHYAQDGDSPNWKIVASIGGDPTQDPGGEQNLPANVFELDDNQLMQDAKCSPVWRAQLSEVPIDPDLASEEVAHSFRTWQKEGTSVKAAAERARLQGIFGISTSDLVIDLFDQLIQGNNHFLNFHYVFRVTKTITAPSQLTCSFVGVKKIWTAGQVVNYEDPPADLCFSIMNVAAEWLKCPPNVVNASGGRTQIKYEYWGADSWSRLHYEVHS